jgi:hypothetical protein
MTYNTRQEVLRAAADWIDVCEKAGIEAMCKYDGYVYPIEQCSLGKRYSGYEFPLALLEGKEVWVGSELWCTNSNHWFKVKGLINGKTGLEYETPYAGRICTSVKSGCSWNQPKPKTVMIEMLVEDANHWAKIAEADEREFRFTQACKKALEKL